MCDPAMPARAKRMPPRRTLSPSALTPLGTPPRARVMRPQPSASRRRIEPLLKTNCTSCHGATVQNMNVRVDTYANLKASLSDVTDLLVNGGMPPAGPLSDADIQLFQSWVDQGALNN